MLSRLPKDNWVYVSQINSYIPKEHLETALEVLQEVANPAFQQREHGKPAVYNEGCRGPLCRKTLRDRKHKSRDTELIKHFRVRDLDPLLIAFRRWHIIQLHEARLAEFDKETKNLLQVS